MKASMSKGVYNLNPTDAVMKLGSEKQRESNKEPRKVRDMSNVPEAHEVPMDTANLGSAMKGKTAFGEGHISDFYGVENMEHNSAHPAMQTRQSHEKNKKHADGRKHEDHHHAVKALKGKM